MSLNSPHNWAAAFVCYCNNHPLEEISDTLCIPLSTLENKILQERWPAMRGQLCLATNGPLEVSPAPVEDIGPRDPFAGPEASSAVAVAQKMPPVLAAKLAALAANREINYKDADNLRKHAQGLLTSLVEGTLEMEQLYHNKGEVVRAARRLSPADMVNIATYVRIIQDMTYRALGDVVVGEKGQDAPTGGNHAPPQITIYLPAAIAQPRELRESLDMQAAKVIDIKTVSESPDSSNKA